MAQEGIGFNGSYRPGANSMGTRGAFNFTPPPKPRTAPAPSRASSSNISPIAAPAPPTSSAPRYSTAPLGAYGGGGGSAPAAPAAPAKPTEKDWIAGDKNYKGQEAALQRALDDYTSNSRADSQRYGSDYMQGVKRLGYREAVVDDPATPENEAMDGQWDTTDTSMAAGRAFQNQQNDFAGRGMLQSSGYKEANDGLMLQLQEQYDGMAKGKSDFDARQTAGITSFTGETDDAKKAAMREAISRYAALYGQL